MSIKGLVSAALGNQNDAVFELGKKDQQVLAEGTSVTKYLSSGFYNQRTWLVVLIIGSVAFLRKEHHFFSLSHINMHIQKVEGGWL